MVQSSKHGAVGRPGVFSTGTMRSQHKSEQGSLGQWSGKDRALSHSLQVSHARLQSVEVQ